MTKTFEFVTKDIKSGYRTYFLSGLFLLAVGIGFIILNYFYYQRHPGISTIITGTVLSLPFIIISFFLIKRNFKDPKVTPIYIALNHENENIVWVYVKIMNYGLFPSTDFIVNLIDGTIYKFTINELHEKDWFYQFKTMSPNACVGFTDAKQKQFLKNPASLLNYEEKEEKEEEEENKNTGQDEKVETL
jgi:hypothetical protein